MKFILEVEIEDDSEVQASMALAAAATTWQGVRESIGVEEEFSYRAFSETHHATFVVRKEAL